mmetsp:Transcript_20622/g.44795  ORF Transcript_20622/g.44795 Transcript_20622/m.44795 type:complete len:423 (+) Transcript_20622:174-1442(+)|eukprot:CAMPEP_0172316780 /NCGR_PEP_ID=MMETSP1058-20130122/29459_1 /TAXON_ID=83371 /ORGANISM="Detonula confervacea, Strain CCMP 353" /LENGTH=422 /DNA_ID=CAMNT_0013031185 /DNA_START=106 /DNA_END=1374 /DNA_ORIENTATION=-
MATSTAVWSVPRLIRNVVTQQLKTSNANSSRYSPHDLLSRFDQSSTLTAKQSLKQHRFFMYEEHAHVKLHDDQITPTVTVPPNELAKLLQSNRNASDFNHCYWTCPVASVAPALLNEFQWHKKLHDASEHELLDPRGPSLWMGTSGSGTQCHYDVANNIIVQLHGSKRIRCFPPSVGVYKLHVFPDAHPRARKSQVDFDNSNDDTAQRRRFPHFVDVPQPTLDVILRPGDALEIPAFWFHHVENGHILSNNDVKDHKGDDAPSVSLNSFALSRPMMLAQQIFQKASRPLGRATINAELVSPILKALGTTLIRGLNVVDHGKEEDFIRRYLVDARYSPLVNNDENKTARDNNNHTPQTLTNEQLQQVHSCVERILPDFHLLMEGEGSDGTGIALLVGLHLLELWAVEVVGAQLVAKAWDEALS